MGFRFLDSLGANAYESTKIVFLAPVEVPDWARPIGFTVKNAVIWLAGPFERGRELENNKSTLGKTQGTN